ncbi:MAG: hypothetical protein M3319_16780 [Actinomycetota bacterium]|nr:hypothetical protein [Actinomycetota bacterium]
MKARGCSFTDALAFVAEIIGMVPESNGHKHSSPGRIVKVYDYCDEQGHLQFQVVRYEPKRFRQCRPSTVNADWVWNMEGVSRILYRLPELAQADPARPVLTAEGEKDVDQLCKEGFVATTSPQGAGNWKHVDARPLHGRHVIIVADHDNPGWGVMRRRSSDHSTARPPASGFSSYLAWEIVSRKKGWTSPTGSTKAIRPMS